MTKQGGIISRRIYREGGGKFSMLKYEASNIGQHRPLALNICHYTLLSLAVQVRSF